MKSLFARLHFRGSKRGDCIYGVAMPTYDASDCWKLILGCFVLNVITSQASEREEAAFREASDCCGGAEPRW